MIAEKNCSKCGETFPATLEYFRKKSASPDGLTPWCKSCKNAADKDYHYRRILREMGIDINHDQTNGSNNLRGEK